MLKLSATRWSVLALLLAAPLATSAQTGGVRVGTPGVPDPSAVLDLRPDASAAPKGLLPPRLTGAQRDAIQNPAPGLVILNTDTYTLNSWNGTKWVAYLTDLAEGGEVTLGYTGGPQTSTVPLGGTRLTVDMAGAGGQQYSLYSGLGGRLQAVLNVVPGEVLTIHVGGAGQQYGGGYNGGAGGDNAGGGGGATDLRQGGTTEAYRVLVAGGGGSTCSGGAGGGLTGGTGVGSTTLYNPQVTITGGGGGSQTGPGGSG